MWPGKYCCCVVLLSDWSVITDAVLGSKITSWAQFMIKDQIINRQPTNNNRRRSGERTHSDDKCRSMQLHLYSCVIQCDEWFHKIETNTGRHYFALKICFLYKRKITTKHNAELVDRPRHKSYGRFEHQAPYLLFSHLMPKMDFYHFRRFSWKKYTKIIGYMSWLHQ